MKKMAVIWLLLFARMSFAQQRQVSFSEIDDRVKSIDPAPPAVLAYALTRDYTSDKDKLRSIFSWITDHIAYRVKKNHTNVADPNAHGRVVFPESNQWKSGNDVVAETVLQNRSAVCDGYARLFKSLCDYAGLRSAVITGFAKGDYSRQFTFRCNHTWNAVYIDNAWRLLDVTWASGYTNYSGDTFTKRYDETYFMARPEDFIRDHFPDDIRWTLMNNPPVPNEFAGTPYRNKPYSKYKISSYTPTAGLIEAAIGDTIHIVLETADLKADGKMTPDTLTEFDQDQQKLFASVGIAEPSTDKGNKNKIDYTFRVTDNRTEWLHIVYNNDTILRYRLKIKKEKTTDAAVALGK